MKMTFQQMARAVILLLAGGLLVNVVGCSLVRPSSTDWTKSSREFVRRLRWADATVAGSFVPEAERDAFRTGYPDDGTLRLTDVRMEQLDSPTPDRVNARLTIEYYRIPSATVKKHVQVVEWQCVSNNVVDPCTWGLRHAPSSPP